MRILTGTVATLIACLFLAPIEAVPQTLPIAPDTSLPRFGYISPANRDEPSDPLNDRYVAAIRDQTAATLHITTVDLTGDHFSDRPYTDACAVNHLVGFIEPHATSNNGYVDVSGDSSLVITDCRGFVIYAATGRYAEDRDVSIASPEQVDEVQERSQEALRRNLHAFIAGHEAGWSRAINGGGFVGNEDSLAVSLHVLVMCDQAYKSANYVVAKTMCESGQRGLQPEIVKMNTLLFIGGQTSTDRAAVLLEIPSIISTYSLIAEADAKLGDTTEGREMAVRATEWASALSAYVDKHFANKSVPEYTKANGMTLIFKKLLEGLYPGVTQSGADALAAATRQ
jgi:hypothetical protein